jgi:hypothetical protein
MGSSTSTIDYENVRTKPEGEEEEFGEYVTTTTTSVAGMGWGHAWVIFWGMVIFAIVVGSFALLGGMMDNNQLTSGNSQGFEFKNDRHVPVSSVWRKTTHLHRPSFNLSTVNSTSSAPGNWDGIVIITYWNGTVTAVQEHTGVVIWSKSICVDWYELLPGDCAAFNANKQYISVATPTVWRSFWVISIRKPADVVVVHQKTGNLLRKRNLDSNPYAEVTASGTVWNNDLYIGTSISDFDAEEDSGTCTFTGQFFKILLDDEDMDNVWVFNPADAYGDLPAPSGFTGMRIKGSSPPLSLRSGLIALTIDGPICGPTLYTDCIAAVTCDSETFTYSVYEQAYDSCYNNETTGAHAAFFNSVVVLRTDTGEVYWHEKLLGARAWELACYGYNASDPCENWWRRHGDDDDDDDGPCDFYHNRYLNCVTEMQSCEDDFDWADDPAYKLPASGAQWLYVAQKNGNIYAFDFLRQEGENRRFERSEELGIARSKQLYWAISVRPHGRLGGLAVDRDFVYFSAYYNPSLTLPWIFGNNVTVGGDADADDPVVSGYSYTPCGGWGALQVYNHGLPQWYLPDPMCNQTYDRFDCFSDDTPLDPQFSGGRSAPAVTNDLVVVTSSDTSRSFETPPWDTNVTYCGGHVYALQRFTGSVVSRVQTGEPFGKQGVMLHGRCIYAGNGPNPYYLPAAGNSFLGWCTPQAYPIIHDHEFDDGPFN